MPNIAAAFKGEIVRLARKELRSEAQPLKRAVVAYRGELAALKRRIQALEQELGKSLKARSFPSTVEAEDGSPKSRFSAKSLASQRKRLGLSAHGLGLLLGASGQSIYNWEAGKVRPRAKQLTAIAALKTLNKRKAAEIVRSRSEASAS